MLDNRQALIAAVPLRLVLGAPSFADWGGILRTGSEMIELTELIDVTSR
jgi:hypothetical protein